MKKNRIIQKIALSIAIMACFQGVKAQKDTVVVLGNYNPTIVKFKKPSFSPSINDSEVVRQKVDYIIFPQPLQHELELKPIKAAKISGEAFDPLTANYLKAGFGNYKTPFFELWLSNKRSKDFSTVLQLKHLSSSGKIKNYSFAGQSENLGFWKGSKYFSKYALSTEIRYRRNVVHQYGFQPEEWIDSTLNKDNTKLTYQRLGAGIDFERTNIDKKAFQHKYHLDFNRWWNQADNSENEMAFHTSMNKNVAWLPISKSQNISLDLKYQHFFEKNKQETFNGGLLHFSPKYKFMFDVVNLDLGIDLSARTDSVGEAYILPLIRMELNLFPGLLSMYGEFKGEAKYNSLNTLSDQNPFINSFVHPSYSVDRKQLSAGIRGSMFKSFTYHLGARFVTTEQMVLFVPDTITTFEHTYTTIQDDVDVFSMKFDGTLSISKKWNASINFSYHIAEAKNQVEAWHIPQFDGQLKINYNLENKIIVELGLFALGMRNAPSYLSDSLEVKTLKPVFDINLGLEYRYSKQLSGFVKFNNMSAARYYAWLNYPNYRFSFLAGITYNF